MKTKQQAVIDHLHQLVADKPWVTLEVEDLGTRGKKMIVVHTSDFVKVSDTLIAVVGVNGGLKLSQRPMRGKERTIVGPLAYITWDIYTGVSQKQLEQARKRIAARNVGAEQ